MITLTKVSKESYKIEDLESDLRIFVTPSNLIEWGWKVREDLRIDNGDGDELLTIDEITELAKSE
jgi:hypothetical protein